MADLAANRAVTATRRYKAERGMRFSPVGERRSLFLCEQYGGEIVAVSNAATLCRRKYGEFRVLRPVLVWC